jgi:hypothetical protein
MARLNVEGNEGWQARFDGKPGAREELRCTARLTDAREGIT